MSTQSFTYVFGTNVTLAPSAVIAYFDVDRSGEIVDCELSAETAGSGGTFTVDVLKNGVSQFAVKPELGSGVTDGAAQAANGGNTFVAGDRIKVTVIGVGSTAPVRVAVRLRVNFTGVTLHADALTGTPGNHKGYGTNESGVINWYNRRCVIKIPKTYTDFATGGTTNAISLVTLPASVVIHSVKLKHSASFSGGSIATYTIQVGITGTANKYLTASNVFQSPGDTVLFYNNCEQAETHGAGGTDIKATATSGGANLDAATSGSVAIWIEYSVMS
jgi:hypothetical protein